MGETVSTQLRLLTVPIVGLVAMGAGHADEIAEANDLLVRWGHKLGKVERPFRQEAYALEVDGVPISVAISASTVSKTVRGALTRKVNGGKRGETFEVPVCYRRTEVVELARLGSDPAYPWASRVMLRLWRSVLAQRWDCWPVVAAVSYSHNRYHDGELYRFDGWELINERCGSRGGGNHSRLREDDDAVYGPKRLWLWKYGS